MTEKGKGVAEKERGMTEKAEGMMDKKSRGINVIKGKGLPESKGRG